MLKKQKTFRKTHLNKYKKQVGALYEQKWGI